MISEPPPEDPETLSPELVLVSSAEVARRAREQLPEVALPVTPASRVHAEAAAATLPAPAEGATGRAPTPVDRSPPPAYPRTVVEELEPEPPRHRSRRWVALAACLLGAVVAVGGYLTETKWHVSHPPPAAAVPAAPLTLAAQKTPPRAALHPPATLRQSPTISVKSAVTQKSPIATPKPAPAITAPGASAPKRPNGFVPARTWAWVPVDGADAYEVTFFLAGRVVLQARPKEPRLVVPSSFRYHAGRYRWTVRPLPASATGKPIVDGTFVLTPATASAANGS